MVNFFSGRDGVIYSIHPTGELFWYRHLGFADGTISWASNGLPVLVGSGWSAFTHVLGSNNGVIYVIDAEGVMKWYQHLGHKDGSSQWAADSGKVIGSGWNMYERIVAGDDGLLYGIKSNGELYWYRHTGHSNGANTWVNQSGLLVGSSWNEFNWVGLSSRGVIYARCPNGDLIWYQNHGYQYGTSDWAPSVKVGTGWDRVEWVTVSNDGIFYLCRPDSRLAWFRHDGVNNGSVAWRSKEGIGTYWKSPSPYEPPVIQDGTYTIRAKSNKKYMCRDGAIYVANRDAASTWERFTIAKKGTGWTIKDFNGEFWCRSVGNGLSVDWGVGQSSHTSPTLAFGPHAYIEPATVGSISAGWGNNGSTTWEIIHKGGDDYAFRPVCGLAQKTYVTAEPSGVVAIDREDCADWEIFTLTRV